MATERPPRDQLILDALAREIRRQGVSEVEALDLVGLARSIDSALGSERREARIGDTDGLEPEELNSANDV